MKDEELQREDPTRRKVFKNLVVREGSVVDMGGHGDTPILMFRDGESTSTSEVEAPAKKTWLERVKSLFSRGYDEDGKYAPESTSERLKSKRMHRALSEVQECFTASMHDGLTNLSGGDQVAFLKKTVGEYGEEMERAFGDRPMSGAEEEFARSLIQIDDVLSGVVTNDLPVEAAEVITRALDPLGSPPEKSMQDKTTGDTPAVEGAGISAASILEALRGDSDLLAEVQRSLEPKEDPTVEEIKRDLDEPAANVLTELQRSNDDLAKKVASLEAGMQKLSDDRQTSDLAEIARSYEGLGQTEDQLVGMIRKARENGFEADILRTLDAAKAQAGSSPLLQEVGRGNRDTIEGSAMAEVTRQAEDLRKSDPKQYPSVHVARAAIYDANPSLRAKVAEEDQARAAS